MSLYKRGDIWWVKLYQDGVPVYKTTKMPDKREAQRLHDIWAGELRQGTFLPQVDQTRYEELVEDLRQHYRNTESRDLVEVNKRLKHLDAFFAGTRAAKIDAALVARYIEQRKAQKSANGTTNRELGVLTRMFRLALENGRVTRVPIIRKLKEAAPRQGFFEREPFEAVRKHLSEDLQAAATVAYTFGWRTQSEVLTLERRQLDLAAETLRLDPGTTKNDDGRLVYLTPELKTLLTAQVERVKTLERQLERIIPYLFPHLPTPHVSSRLVGTQRRDFRKAWVTACKLAGVPGALRHDCRRTAVRNMVNEGVPERVAMKVTGHRTRSVFDRYHIVSPADLKEASRKLARSGQ
jgi:site-specific recombinase XerD